MSIVCSSRTRTHDKVAIAQKNQPNNKMEKYLYTNV